MKAVSVPSATPPSMSAAPPAEVAASPTAAAEAAVKIAAQVAIVSGFDAVRRHRGDEGAPGRGHLVIELAAEAHAERRPERPGADDREHEGAGDSEGHPQGVDLEQARRACQAEAGVEQVDQRRAGADRDAVRERAAQHAADAEQRHRARLRADEETESEAHERASSPCRAYGCAPAGARARRGGRPTAAPTSAIQASASDIGAGVGR